MTAWYEQIAKTNQGVADKAKDNNAAGVPGKQTHVDANDGAAPAAGAGGGSVFDVGIRAVDTSNLRMALQIARQECDQALDAPNGRTTDDHARIGAAAQHALESAELANQFATNSDIDPALSAEVDLTTRSLGRMYAYIRETNDFLRGVFVPTDAGWLGRTERTVLALRLRANLKGKWIGDIVDGQAKAADDETDPAAAREQVIRWNTKATGAIEAVRRWQVENFIKLWTKTNSNPSVSWSPKFLEQTASNAVGNVLTLAGKEWIENMAKGATARATAKLGGGGLAQAGGWLAGGLVGFFIGLAIETIASIVYDLIVGYDERRAQEEMLAKMSESGGEFALKLHAQVSDAATAEQNQLDAKTNAAHRDIDSATTQARVDAIEQDARRQANELEGKTNPQDESLYKALLKEWVLENADDEEKANKQTSNVQWENAANVVFGEKSANNQPTLFAYQSRATWTEAGLKSEQVSKAFADMTKAPAADASWRDSAPIANNGKTFTFTGVDAEKLLTYINRHSGVEHAKDFMSDRQNLVKVDGDKVSHVVDHKVDCTLDLVHVDGTTYVNHWTYAVKTPGDDVKFRVQPSKVDTKSMLW